MEIDLFLTKLSLIEASTNILLKTLILELDKNWEYLITRLSGYIYIPLNPVRVISSIMKQCLQNNVSSSIEGNNFYILLTVGLPRKSFPISFTYALKPFRT